MGGVNKRRIKGVEGSGRAVYTSVECGVCVAECVCGVQWSSKPMRGVLCCGCVGDMRWGGCVLGGSGRHTEMLLRGLKRRWDDVRERITETPQCLRKESLVCIKS